MFNRFTRIRQWLEPPYFAGDEEATTQARMLNMLIVNFGAVLLVFIFILVPFFASQKVELLALLVTLFIGLLIGRALIFHRRVRWGSILIIALSYLSFFCFAILSNGIDSPGMFFLSALILVTGFFINVRAANRLMVFTVLMALGIIFLESQGLALPKIFTFTPLTGWLAFGLGLAFMTSARNLILHNLESALGAARRQNALLQKAEQSLRDNEERYRNLYENSTIGLYRTTPEGRFLLANPTMVEMMGLSSFDDLANRNLEKEGFAPDYERTHFLETIEQAGEVKGLETAWTRKDGTTIFVRESARAVRDEQGKTLYYDGIVEDITEHKQAEDAKILAQENFRLIFENATVGIFQSTPDGRFRTVNRAMAHIYGYDSPEEMLAHITHIGSQIYVDSASRAEFQRILAEFGEVTEFIGENYRKDGRIIWTVTNARAVKDKNGQALYYEGFITDITERQHMEDSLRESELRFRSFIEQSPVAIVISRNGIVLYANRKLLEIFGLQIVEEIIGRPTFELFAPQYQQESKDRSRRRSLGLPVSNDFESIGLRVDGSQFPVHLAIASIHLPDGDANMGFVTDITDRKHAEERVWQSEKKYRELFQVNKDGIAIFLVNPYGPPSTFVEVNDAAPRMLGYTREEMLNLSPLMLEPLTTPEQLQARQAEIEANGMVNFETVLLHKNGHLVFTEFSVQAIHYEGQLAVMNIVRDVTERKQRESELQSISSLSAALRTAPTRAEMLPVIVEQLGRLLHCDSISVEMIDPLTQEAVVEAAYGDWSSVIGYRQPPEKGLNAVIAKTRQPYSSNDIKADHRHGFPDSVIDQLQAAAGVPLIAQDQLIGFLWMGQRKEIAESEVRLLAAVADIAANALFRATLHEQTQKDAANLAGAYDTTLEGWAHALELRDQETEGHTRRVVQMTLDLARALGFKEDELENVRRGALLHDIGKMGIPDSVLLKPGTLNDREWEIMRRHPEYAYQLLDPIDYLRPALDIPYCHHEKWDGSGYPRGLKGEQIPRAARIFAIVDVWDALRSDRPYRQGWTNANARKYILGQSGSHFDPQVVQAFLELAKDLAQQ